MTQTASFSPYGSPDTLIAGSAMDSLPNTNWLNGGSSFVINNSTQRSFYMDIELILGSDVTAGSGAPSVDLYMLSSANGTTYPTPRTASAAAAGKHRKAVFQALAGATFRQDICPGIVIPPGWHIFLIQNKLGVDFPTGNTLLGYRYAEQAA